MSSRAMRKDAMCARTMVAIRSARATDTTRDRTPDAVNARVMSAGQGPAVPTRKLSLS
ncbi:hypothetical protein [Streptomyces sp. CAU 1734]|uniref:hypothetical protein n=1 Tax=Streptomyces sp. CAU 1734 TaxID=3140360 RepID=UPI0032609E8F